MGKKLEGIQRMLVIINKLKERQRYVPREELEEYVRLRMEERDATPVDIRTIQRDFKDIEDLFGICIRFDKKRNGYYINEEDSLIKPALLVFFQIMGKDFLFTHSAFFAYIYIIECYRMREFDGLYQCRKAFGVRRTVMFGKDISMQIGCFIQSIQ